MLKPSELVIYLPARKRPHAWKERSPESQGQELQRGLGIPVLIRRPSRRVRPGLCTGTERARASSPVSASVHAFRFVSSRFKFVFNFVVSSFHFVLISFRFKFGSCRFRCIFVHFISFHFVLISFSFISFHFVSVFVLISFFNVVLISI